MNDAEARNVPLADRIIGAVVTGVAIAVMTGAIGLAAPLALEEGWQSPSGVRFLLSSGFAVGLAGFVARHILVKLRR